MRDPLKISITRANECFCGNKLGGFLERILAILLELETLRKCEDNLIGILERFHDGFNINGSYVNVGNFHEVKEAWKIGYYQCVNIVKEVCKELFRDSFLEIE